MTRKVWKPGDPVMVSEEISLDTETEPIRDHTPPPVVTLQVYGGGDEGHLVWWTDIPQYMDEMLRWNLKTRWVFHNCAFDLAVLGYPEPLMRAVEEGRLHDTMMHYGLHRIATEGWVKSKALDSAVWDVLKIKMDKSEDIRLTFRRDMVLDDPHMEYAMGDSVLTFNLRQAMLPHRYPTEIHHVKGAIALDRISRKGIGIDMGYQAELRGRLEKERNEILEILADNEYVPEKDGNQEVLQNMLAAIEKKENIKFNRTEKTDKISVSEEALEKFSIDSKFLNAYTKYAHLNKLISTYLRVDAAGTDGRVHTRFNAFLNSGRCSSSEPNICNGYSKTLLIAKTSDNISATT